MKIIGLDPGTAFGWAIRYDDQRMDAGVWDLKPRRFEGGGMRWLRLRGHLRELLKQGPGLVAYEEVRRHLGVDAAHIYGGAVAVIQEECEALSIPYLGVPVATVKKLATGKGNAGKEQMLLAARGRWKATILDDNEADARWIAEAGFLQLGRAA